jgi:hypothetical protein
MLLGGFPGHRRRGFFDRWRRLRRSESVRHGGCRLGRGLTFFALRGLRFESRGLIRRRLRGLVGFRNFESVEPAQLYRHVFID